MGKNPLTKFFIIALAGLLIFLVYLYLTVGIKEMADVFKRLDLRICSFYYATAFMAVFSSTLFYSISWNKLMETLGIKKIGLRKVFLYCWLGILVDSITPFETISGEITRIYLVQRETNEQTGKIVASIVAHRIILTSIALTSLAVSSFILIMKYNISPIILYPLLALVLSTAALIILLLLASLRKGFVEKIIDPILNFISHIFRGRINLLETRSIVYTNLQCYYSDFRQLCGKRKMLIWATFYGLLSWFLHLSVFFLTFYALNFLEITSKVYETIVIYSINMSFQASPISLAPGLIEMVLTNLYILLGFNAAISGTATLLIRIATFWFPVIFGGIVSQLMGVKRLFTQANKNTSTC